MTEGDISVVIDTLEFNGVNGEDCSLLHVTGDIYAIAYRGPDNDGFVCTVDIDTSGNIGAAVIDSLEFDPLNGYYPDLIHVAGEVYAIAYRGADNYGNVCTFTIDNSGNIGASTIDSLVFDSTLVEFPSFIHIYSDICAIAYKGSLSRGRVVTVDIDSSGNIGAAIIDSLYFDGTNCSDPDIVHVNGDIYAIAYCGTDNDGFVCTVDIDNSGNIGSSTVDSLEFDNQNCNTPSLLHVTGDIYAIAYNGFDSDGFVCTVDIDNSGNIGAAIIDSFEFDTLNGYSPIMIHVSNQVYAVSYRGDLGDGWTVTFSIDAAGNISASTIDSLEFDTADCNMPDMIHIAGDVYAIAYEGDGDDGWIKTIGIETIIASGSKHFLIMGI
jgi:hypothetical protein